MTLPFDSNGYYVLYNSAVTNSSLALGYTADPPNTPFMDISDTYSSENWQLFHDDGVYFIRNYDFNGTYQLSLNETNPTFPIMRPSTSELGMQWYITAGSIGGTYLIRNALLGDANVLTTWTNTEDNNIVEPVMNTDETDGAWTISKNPSRTTVLDSNMLQSYTSIEVTPPTATRKINMYL